MTGRGLPPRPVIVVDGGADPFRYAPNGYSRLRSA